MPEPMSKERLKAFNVAAEKSRHSSMPWNLHDGVDELVAEVRRLKNELARIKGQTQWEGK